MRRALIFLSSFIVSIIVIYMVYYYSNIHKHSTGLVAFASDLPNTIMGPADESKGEKNFIGSRSVAGTDTVYSLPAATISLRYDTVYNPGVLNAINDEVSNEFRGHPPIGFGHVKDGERIFFNYIFRRIGEEKFVMTDTGILLDGKRLKYFLCRPAKGVVLYRSEVNGLAYFHAPLKDGSFMIVQEEGPGGIVPEMPVKKFDSGAVLLPYLDFNIVKLWKKEEAENYRGDVAEYAHIEERVKFKIEPMGKARPGEKAVYTLKPPLRISFFQSAQIMKPYLELRLRDTELLLKQK